MKQRDLDWILILCVAVITAIEASACAAAPPIGVKRPVITNPEPISNLAYKKPVEASSFWREGSEGLRIVDGIIGTNLYGSWQSAKDGPKPAWVQIDLGETLAFDAIRLYITGQYGVAMNPLGAFRIYAGNTPGSLSKVFEASADQAEQYVNRTIQEDSALIRFSKQQARYLKMEIEGEGKVTLGELEVFNGEPSFRTIDSEPGDTRIHVREKIKPQVLAKDDNLLVWLETAAEKVFRDDNVNASNPVDTVINIDAARGEAESVQVVFKSKETFDGITWSFGDLLGPEGATIPATQLKANPVGYYYVRQPAGFETHRLMVNGWGSEYTSIGEGWFPDILLDKSDMHALAGKHQPLWVTVTIPRDAKPGIYEGPMSIALPSGESINLTIKTRVRTFAIPEVRTLKTYANLLKEDQSYIFQHLDSVKMDETTMRNVYKLFAENAFGPALLWPGPDITWSGETPEFNWSRFDRMASYCFDELKMPYATVPGTLFAYHGAFYTNTGYIGKEMGELGPEWWDAFEKVTAEWGRHLAEKGWDKRFGFYIGNEVQSLSRPEVVDRAAELMRRAKKVAPNLVYIWHSGPLDPPGLEEADVFVFNPRRTPMPLLQERYDKGKENFAYVNYSKCTNSPTMACRGTGWILFKHRITGYTLHSTAAAWAGSTPYQFVGEANGTFFYPPWEYGGPFMNSVRLAMFRDGFDDYEYLTMLERAIKAANTDPSKASAVAEAQQVLADARAFAGAYGFDGSIPEGLDHPGRLAWGNDIIDRGIPAFDHREDPEQLMALRKRVADSIEALMESITATGALSWSNLSLAGNVDK